MHGTTDATGNKALALLRSFTDDMREWGVVVSSEEKLTALARGYFADEQSSLGGLLLILHGMVVEKAWCLSETVMMMFLA
ncbi:hypothetical protein ACK85T_004663 [Salmonella enterica]